MLELMLTVIIFLFLGMTFVWILYRRTNNPSIVDVSWSLGLMIAGLIYLSSDAMNLRLELIGALLIAWALRLAVFLWFTRIRLGHVDKRYLELSENWKIAKSLGFFLNFQLQAVFIFMISTPFLLAASDPSSAWSYLDCVAGGLVLVALLGESLADFQLQQFRKNHPGKVCNQGLWKFSRHPNYFFEWLIWCGFALFGWQSTQGYLSLISPLTLFFIFFKLTGPITEQSSIRSRGQAYLDYQAQTSFFFPWFRR